MTKEQERFLEYLKERYYFELERKEKLNANVNNPMTLIIIVLGVITFFVQNSIALGWDVLSIFFYVFLSLAATSVLVSGYFLVRSFYRYHYSYLPMASGVENDLSRIKNYYKDPYFRNHSEDEIARLIDDDVFNLYSKKYIDCIDRNIVSNERKNEQLMKTSSLLILGLFFLFMSSIPFFLKTNSFLAIHKADIANGNQENSIMADEKEKTSDSKEPPEQPPPKPETTPVRTVIEGRFSADPPEEKPVKPDSSESNEKK